LVKVFAPTFNVFTSTDCERLAEVGTLPDTLMELELWDCADLENIEGLCGLAKLQMLKIKIVQKWRSFLVLER
jgi:hypothetical protein